MRKIRAIKYLGIILSIIYLFVIVVAYYTEYISGTENLIFSVLLAVLSLFSCFKGSMIRSFSTLWFGITLILYALLIIIFEVKNFSYSEYIYVFAFLPIITSLIFICFRKLNYIKVMIINLSIAIPILLSNIFEIKIGLNIAIFSVSILVGIIVCRLINTHREKVYNG